jgi:cytochrome c553
MTQRYGSANPTYDSPFADDRLASSALRGRCWVRNVAGLILGLAMLTHDAAHGAEERVDELIQAAMQLEPKLSRGEKLYQEHCRDCHGASAYGSGERLVPALAGQRRAYLIKQLADFTELERVATEMHRVVARSEVSEPQAWMDLASYLNGLPVNVIAQTGNGEMVSLGEALYDQWCVSCHEEDARGDDEGFVPSLRNQHYAYLAREMRGMGAGHRFNIEPDLARFLNGLTSDEIVGMADYLSRLRGPIRDRDKLHDDGTAGD